MRVLAACAAGAFLALTIPLGSASAAMPGAVDVQPIRMSGAALVQADWDGHRDWHHRWRHEWRDHWRPEWHPYWHRHWHRGWDRPYGYQY